MKITFEAETFQDVLAQMESVLASSSNTRRIAVDKQLIARGKISQFEPPVQGPGPEAEGPTVAGTMPSSGPVDNGDNIPEQLPEPEAEAEPTPEPTPRQKAMAKARAARKPRPAPVSSADMMETPPPPKSAEGMDPAEVVRIRQKTIEDLQFGYANGFQKEVFELLSRFGNGAKSFRELPPESFVPIREAIDNGALT